MAPNTTQSLTSKVKRPPGIITNGIHSSTSSPSPSMSASRLPNSGAKYPPTSAISNGAGSSTSAVRSANRARRDGSGHLLGRGQRNGSVGVGLRSGSVAGEHFPVQQISDPPPYIKNDEYILRRYRGNPPSLVVHLHTTHFRFDGQDGNFGYRTPMRLLLEHLRLRTVPQDLVEFFAQNNVPFYEGCMIVQVVDHKSNAPTQESIRTSATSKSIPFSVHNNNPCLTPFPWVPYTVDNGLPGKGKVSHDAGAEDAGKSKTSEQKDKENMPAPSFPADGQRGKSIAQIKKLKTSTIVLHPTIASDHADFMAKTVNSRSLALDGRPDLRPDGPLSATVPPTPSSAVPSTPQTSMAPPAKRVKTSRPELNANNVYEATSKIVLGTTAPLMLDPVHNIAEASALLDSLAHPMHAEKPPSPKTRKRTVAEMAADEEAAAAEERYMLIFDEKNASNALGGVNAGDGDGQAGGASFEPRFERFKTIDNIRNLHEENKRSEKARQQEAERKNLQERERERLRQESDKKTEQDRLRNISLQHAANVQRQQQDAQRRVMAQAQQPQQGFQGAPGQAPGQHAHPQPSMPNGIQSQPQRFHQQHVSQAQASSPIVRNGTPQNHSSPTVNHNGPLPMQQSTSSMGGSPPRPGSVVNPQIGGPGAHGMTAQRSQQSHAGTPRMPSATPVQSTPRNRQMSGTPRMSQASPLQNQMAQTPHQGQMMHNGQPMQLNAAQQNALNAQHQQQALAQRQQRMQREQAMATLQQQMNNGQPMNPNQAQMFQNQLMRAQAQQAAVAQQGGSAQIAQTYQAQLAQMAQQTGRMPQNMNFNGQGGMSMQQMHQMQQVQHAQQMQQMQQLQAQAAAQQAQNHQQPQISQQQQHQQQQQQQQHAMMMAQIQKSAAMLYHSSFPALQAQHPGGIPEEVMQRFKAQCQQNATQSVQQQFRARRQMVQQQQMLAQQQQQQQQGVGTPNGMNMNMGMQRPNGM